MERKQIKKQKHVTLSKFAETLNIWIKKNLQVTSHFEQD